MPESRILCTTKRILIFCVLRYNERKFKAEEVYRWKMCWRLSPSTVMHGNGRTTTISAWYRRDIVPTLPTLVKVCDAFQITLTEFFSVVESGEREPVILTQDQAEVLEQWSALRPEQQDAVRHLLSTMP